jgi:predicted hydrocarbon binding protein
MATNDVLASCGLSDLVAGEPFGHDAEGRLIDPAGARVVFATAQAARSLRRVLETEETGAWHATMKECGRDCGAKIAARIDAVLAGLDKPVLTALPLEACLALLEHLFAAHGWGRLQLDLADAAEHGIVVARLEHSFFVETLAEADGFADAVLAGILRGFFGHVSGQALDCEEIACARSGAPHCTFVLTAPERLAAIAPLIGREDSEALLARLRQ